MVAIPTYGANLFVELIVSCDEMMDEIQAIPFHFANNKIAG